MTDLGNKLHAANDLRMRLTDEHDRNTAALLARLQMHRVSSWPACSGPCEQGKKMCPSPEACQRPADELDDVVASVWFFGILAVALVAGAYLLSGGAVDLAMWLRGLL